MARSNEPMWWSLFSAGGMVAAILLPVHLLIFGILIPFGVIDREAASYDHLKTLITHPLMQVVLFGCIFLCLFHAAHRLRYALADLGFKSLGTLLPVFCYGGAILGSVAAAAILITLD